MPSIGAAGVVKCPRQIAIVSTGLIFHNTEERKHLMSRSFGMVILDEAHRARGKEDPEEKERVANNSLSFMFEIAKRARHVLLGTATPIQTDIEDFVGPAQDPRDGGRTGHRRRLERMAVHGQGRPG